MIQTLREARARLRELRSATAAPVIRLAEYASRARPRLRSTDDEAGLAELARYFGPWWRSFGEPEGLTDGSRPWLTYPAIDFVRDAVRPDWTVFEFGGGGSTIFFALNCRDVLCVEHDGGWADRLNEAVKRFGLANCRIQHIAPAPAAEGAGSAFRTGVAWLAGLSFEAYVRAIEACEDRSLDLILVDGRARVACVRAAIPKLKPGGLLILDDSERERYRPAFESVPADWRRLEFPGPYAKTRPFGRTTIWIAPDA